MRLLSCEIHNFGSYKHLEIDFEKSGLTLVQGKTGSGKSTLADMPCWILYGCTAKNGSVDEVRSWQSPDKPTSGILAIETSTGIVTVHRIRGKPSQNDLWYIDNNESDRSHHRGKDINETQKLLEARLGVSWELYITSSYFHEFSPTGLFFTSKAKDKRSIFEKIVNLSFPTKLSEISSSARKITKKTLQEREATSERIKGRIEQLLLFISDSEINRNTWTMMQNNILQSLKIKRDKYEKEKQDKISALLEKLPASIPLSKLNSLQREKDNLIEEINSLADETCPLCNTYTENTRSRSLCLQLEDIIKKEDNETRNANIRKQILDQVEAIKHYEHNYDERIYEETVKENPYNVSIESNEENLKLERNQQAIINEELDILSYRLSALDKIYDLSFVLRGELLKKSVSGIERAVNRYLDQYFESELRVYFSLQDGSDSFEVKIQKSGYDCVYQQLSKGQRGLLKLTFVVSVMKAASSSTGVHFDNLFLDEALDGLDSDLKVKAFRMLTELSQEHESIMVIDHAEEFKSLFDRKISVSLINDYSVLEEDNG